MKLIEWRWKLAPLTARDASDDVANLLEALDLRHRDTAVPDLPEPPFPAITPCSPLPLEPDKWGILAELAAALGISP